MTYNVFGGTLSLTQSITVSEPVSAHSRPQRVLQGPARNGETSLSCCQQMFLDRRRVIVGSQNNGVRR